MRALAFTLALVLAACASERAGTDGSSVVALDELPPEHREVLDAYTEGGTAWEEMRERVRAEPALLRFTVENLAIEMVRAYDAFGGPDYDRARPAFDRARAELVRLAPSSTAVLAELFAVGDGVVARLAGETLIEIGGGAAALVAPMLDDEDPQRRRRAAVLLRELPPVPHIGPGRSDVSAHLARLVASDREWFVRAECAWTLGVRAGRERDPRAARSALEQALRDPDPVVAAYAARGLGALADPRSLPALVRSLGRAVQEGNPKLLRSAQDALKAATGTSRDRDIEGWRSWWDDHSLEAVQKPH